MLNDLWEFDPSNNIWTQLSNGKPEKRAAAFVFVVDDKAYIGGGSIKLYDSTKVNTDIMIEKFANQGDNYIFYYKDLWELDVTSGIWTRKKNLPSSIREEGEYSHQPDYLGFSGQLNGHIINKSGDIWQYDHFEDKWASRSSASAYSSNSSCFFTWLWHSASASTVMTTLNNKLYVVANNTGVSCNNTSGYWEYDIQNDSWQEVAEPSLDSMIRFEGICTANDKLYFFQAHYIALKPNVEKNGTGYSIRYDREFTNELWELDPNK